MATTTATITISSSDLTGDALSLSTTATLTKAASATGLDQTTGVARKFFASAQANTTLIAAADYTAGKAHKVYIKNTSTSNSEFVKVELGSGNLSLGFLYGGDFMFIPYDGENDIDIDTSDVNMTVEFLVIYEA
tara:strand:+ start:855 stop:1256 length:402 start_codon:yes stop_codon:yes gene_type:complete